VHSVGLVDKTVVFDVKQRRRNHIDESEKYLAAGARSKSFEPVLKWYGVISVRENAGVGDTA
jgi:hypothetical protein